MIFRYVLTLALAFALTGMFTGQSYSADKAPKKLRKKINNSSMIARFPGAPGIIVDFRVDIEVKPDYSFTEKIYKLIKVITPNKAFNETFIHYSGDWNTVKVTRARTVKRDGSVVNVSSKAIIHKDKPHPMGYKTNQRTCNVVFPAVQPGAATELAYTKTTRGMSKNSFYMGEYLMAGMPIHNFKYTVRVPKSIPYTKAHIDKLPMIRKHTSTSGGKRIYTFTAKNIPAFKQEPNSYLANQMRRIVLTSVRSWDEVYKKVKGYCDKVIDTGPEIKALAKKITRKARTREEKIAAIYYHVSRGIRYVAFEMGKGAWIPRPPQSVCKNQYGDCKDTATLAVSLLRSIGIESYQVLVRAITNPMTGQVIEDLPSSYQFNHMIACVPKKGGGYHWLDCTYKYGLFGQVPPMDEGTNAFIIGKKAYKFKRIDKSSADDNRNSKTITVEIDSDTTSRVKVENEWSGIFRMNARIENFKMKRASRDHMQKWARDQLKDPDLRLISYYLSDPMDFSKKSEVEFRLEYDSQKVTDKIQNLLIYNIRDYLSQFASGFVKEDRKTPLMLSKNGIPFTRHETFNVVAPKGYTVSEKDLPQHVSVDVGDVRITQKVISKPKEVTVSIDMVARKPAVSPENYTRLREKLKEHLGEKKVVFAKKGTNTGGGESAGAKDAAARKLYNKAKIMEMNSLYKKAAKYYQQILDEYPKSSLVPAAKKKLKAAREKLGE